MYWANTNPAYIRTNDVFSQESVRGFVARLASRFSLRNGGREDANESRVGLEASTAMDRARAGFDGARRWTL